MDGNNRWSKKKNISKYEAYKQGAKKLIDIVNFVFLNNDIDYVSAFALSKHNFKRGSLLIDIIKKVLSDFLDPTKDINNYKFRVIFKGNLNFLPKNILEGITKIEKNNFSSKKCLIIYLNYSGKDDIYHAAKSLSKSKTFNQKNFVNYLSSSNIPDPELLIRTGGYKRISDFMLYQISFTELFFINKLWPDIKKSDIKGFFKQFNEIDRKFGN